VSALRAVVDVSPGMLDAWQSLGLALARLGRLAEAVEALQRALRLDPSRGAVHLALARVHGVTGRSDLLETHAKAAAPTAPAEGYELLATLKLEQNRLAEATEAARRSLAADPDRVMGHYVLAVAAQRAGRCDEAVPEFRKAAAAQRLRRGLVVRGLHSGLGDCFARAGREAEAEAEFKIEIEAIPYTRDGRVGLAALYRSQGRDADARSVLEGLVTANPRAQADDYATVVRALSTLGDPQAARVWAARGHALFPGDQRFRQRGH
jgi:Tfp pilus assembly protein PilF